MPRKALINRWVAILGIAVIVGALASPFVFMFGTMWLWKHDLGRGYEETLASVTHEGFTVEYVQYAHEDFYSIILRITSPAGKVRKVMLAYDDFKVLWAGSAREGDRTFFWGRGLVHQAPQAFFDHKLGAVPGEFLQGIHLLDEIDFDPPDKFLYLRDGKPDPSAGTKR